MTQKLQPPQWPEKGEDIEEVNIIDMGEGDAVFFIGYRIAGTLVMRHYSPNQKVMHATYMSPAKRISFPVQIPLLLAHQDILRVGEDYWLVFPGGIYKATGRITVIRIVRAKKGKTAEPSTISDATACPANL